MKTFYKIENNRAQTGSGYIVPKGFIEYKVGNEPKDLIDALKLDTEDLRIENINSYTQSFIITKYPLEKQSSANLGIYGEDYKTEMISFISNCITLSDEAIDNGTSFKDYKAMLNE